MSNTGNNVVITRAGRQKLCRARAGAATLPKVVGMAFGDGGVDINGNVITPSETATGLANELYRKAIDGYEFVDIATCRYTCQLTESELAGEEISEIGLYDQDGDIVALKNFSRKGKDADIRQTYTVDDIF